MFSAPLMKTFVLRKCTQRFSFFFFLRGITLREAFEILEGNDIDDDPSKIYIGPPDANEQSDADSGDKDGGGFVNNLSGKQLMANAKIVFNQTNLKETENLAPPESTEETKKNSSHQSAVPSIDATINPTSRMRSNRKRLAPPVSREKPAKDSSRELAAPSTS